MSTFELTILSSAAARKKAQEKGYNLVFARGVDAGGEDLDYNAAWMTLNPNEMSGEDQVNWEVAYAANYSKQIFKNKTTIKGMGNAISMEPGGKYVVDSTGTLEIDPNKASGGSAFNFYNDAGYSKEYVPILNSIDSGSNLVPIWCASTGVTKHGVISATPKNMVRVWLGKYESGNAVLANYATVAVEFDLTTMRNGTATISDDFSSWTGLSPNATIIDPGLNLILPFADEATHDYLNKLAGGIDVAVVVMFKTALTTAAATYLATKFLNKFSDGLKPSKVEVSTLKGSKMTVTFAKTRIVLATVGVTAYETAVKNALNEGKHDQDSGLAGEKWTIDDKQLIVSCT
jgi:hypothetical protein